MPHVHPTAIVDPQARLAPDVVVGPWCLIEGAVTLGAGCRLFERVSLRGPLVAGERNVFYPHASLGLEPQDRKFAATVGEPGIAIGDDNLFREGVTIHRATGKTPTTIGHRNFFMVNTHAGHDVRVGNDCTLANGALLAGHAELFDQTNLGGNACLHQFCRVGRLGMISGSAAVSQDVPPFCMVYNIRQVGSLNLRGLRRAGLGTHIDSLRRAFDIYYREQHTSAKAVEIIAAQLGADPLVAEFVQFIRTTKRGITGFGLGAGDA